MRASSAKLLIIFLSSCLSGCGRQNVSDATSKAKADLVPTPEAIGNALRPGTSREAITNAFGQPFTQSRLPDGGTVDIYKFSSLSPALPETTQTHSQVLRSTIAATRSVPGIQFLGPDLELTGRRATQPQTRLAIPVRRAPIRPSAQISFDST
jgi:hypothetical protein